MNYQLKNNINGINRHKMQQARADPVFRTLIRKYQNSLKIFAVFCVLGILIIIKESNQDIITENQTLARNEAGMGEVTKHLDLSIPELEEETEYTITVPEQLLTESERNAAFAQAEQEIRESFPGENASADRIIRPVVMKKSLVDGLITAEWLFDDYDVMNSDGTIQEEALSPEGTVVTATVTMDYNGYEEIYEFPFCVYPRELTEKERVYHAIDDYFTAESEKTGKTELTLPDEAAGKTLYWKNQKKHTGFLFIALGVIAAVLIEASARQKEAEKRKERQKLLMCDYPELVNKLSLLLGAGMTVSLAWERIIGLYEKQRKDGVVKERPTYEEMKITFREIKDGVGERAAFEHFGERCELRPYRKLSSLIVQNLRKGSRGLTGLMEAEADEAFELRRNLAKKLGEEAGTKLLAPMLMMFGIIMVIIMVPAFMSFL